MSTHQREDGKPHKKRKIKQKPVLEQVPAPQQQQQQHEEDGNSRFARALGSTDYATREKGLQALSRFLVHKDSMSELDMMKLWKGLFFCFWHSDKAPVQADLAERLAGLLQQMRPAMAQLYWAGLLATLRREWFAMDRHRIDKFLMLVRKFVTALLARLAAAQWDAGVIRSLTVQLPLQQRLIPTDSSKSLGLSYHLADVWLQELKQSARQQQLPQEALLLLLEPFVAVLESSGEQAMLARIKDSVFDVLIGDITAAGAAAAAGKDEDEQQPWAYCGQLDAAQLAAQLFERGAAESVRARNRQALYSISKELERAAGKRRKLAAAAAAAAVGAEPPQQQQRPASEKKLKKKQQHQEPEQQQLTEEQQPQQKQAEQQQELPSAKKKKKRHNQEQPLQELQLQPEQQQQPGVNSLTPKSSKKQKQAAAQREQSLHNRQGTPVTPAAAAAAATPQPAAKPSSSKKKRKHGTVTPAATQAAVAAAAATAAKTPSCAGQGTARKGVVIDLKKNVYFAHGAPVPPQDIRSPPSTKPKGSALKRGRAGGSPNGTPATAPAKKQQGSRLLQQSGSSGRKVVMPNSVPRVKASAFF